MKNTKAPQKFDSSAIETKWQKKWEETKIYSPDLNTAKKPFYNLMMFPYPSAEGLHVGSFFTYGGIDAYGRFKRMQGYDVFEPIGLDGFGIHSENYAIKVGRTPHEHAEISEKNFYRQLHTLGNSFDWERKLETYDPNYYKWTQWLFTELFKAGLAYKAEASVNFCPSCKTVLSDEQVISGACERCGSIVEKKMLSQWFFRITTYAEQLLANTEKLDWTEKVKIAQKNWIGKSTGAQITFKIHDSAFKRETNQLFVDVFTTRPDTLYGVTFLVLSPEHPILSDDAFQSSVRDQESLSNYIERFRKESKDKKHTDKSDDKDKTGIDTGVKAIHPLTGEELPIWVADYVLMEYGTGAIMAVPGHDERDFAFAKKFGLPIQHVIMPSLIDHGNPPRAGKENTIREIILAVIKNPQTNMYLALQWKKYDWTTFVTGGIEDGEDIVSAAQREIREETGYTDLKFVRELGGSTEAYFYAGHKGVNRQTKAHILYFELENEKMVDTNRDSEEQFDILWLTEDELLKTNLRHAEFELLWKRLQTGNDSYSGEGVLINSDSWNGLRYPEDHNKIIAELQKKDIGKAKNTYHLRDWLISRQRYWGPPIPMIYCEHCAKNNKSWFDSEEARLYKDSRLKIQESGIKNSEHSMAGWYPVPLEQLPVELPVVKDFIPLGTGNSPLANHPEFYRTTCPGCGKEALRETDVSDVFLDSAWYFFRYLATDWKNLPFPMDEKKAAAFTSSGVKEAKERMKYLPVTSYIGGAEHAVLHLLYSRFITMVLNDLGYIDFDEPFSKFRANGLIIKDGTKMSKSKGNVIIPDEYIKKYGADTLRTYLMFLGPFSDGGDFQDSGIEGINKFLKRIWTLFTTRTIASSNKHATANADVAIRHKTIKGVTEDIEALRYNTAISKLMTYYHVLSNKKELEKEEVIVFLQLLAPFAPHMTEELWEKIGEPYSIHRSLWPSYNPELIVEEEVTIAIQVNGKLRGTVLISKEKIDNKEEVIRLARDNTQVFAHLDGKEMKREPIYIPGKIINFIVS